MGNIILTGDRPTFMEIEQAMQQYFDSFEI